MPYSALTMLTVAGVGAIVVVAAVVAVFLAYEPAPVVGMHGAREIPA